MIKATQTSLSHIKNNSKHMTDEYKGPDLGPIRVHARRFDTSPARIDQELRGVTVALSGNTLG